MPLKEQIAEQLNELSETELKQMSKYLNLLRSRSKHQMPSHLDEARLAALYGEEAMEDGALADAGMADYAAGLLKEDAR